MHVGVHRDQTEVLERARVYLALVSSRAGVQRWKTWGEQMPKEECEVLSGRRQAKVNGNFRGRREGQVM